MNSSAVGKERTRDREEMRGQGNMTAIVGNYSTLIPYRKSSRCAATRAPAHAALIHVFAYFCFCTASLTIALSYLSLTILKLLKTFFFPKKSLNYACGINKNCIKMYCQQPSKLIFAAITSYYDYNPKSKTSRVLFTEQSYFQTRKQDLSEENEWYSFPQSLRTNFFNVACIKLNR